jgi:uncharacterized protein YkwD
VCALAYRASLAALACVRDDRAMRCAWAVVLLVGSCAGLALRARADDSACAVDVALSNAAAELLLAGQAKPDPLQLTAAVRAAGSDAVALHAVFLGVGAPVSAEQTWLSGLRERSDAPLHCGHAQAEAGRLVIASARAGELYAIDARSRRVRGSIAPGFTRAELVVAAADGQLVRVGVSPSALEHGVELEQDLVAPLKVQLLATGAAGPRPIAERWLGGVPVAPTRPPALNDAPSAQAVPSPTRVERAESSPAEGSARPAVEAASELSRLVLDLRELRGRKRLRDNRLLREAATAHARAVCEQGRVAHTLGAGQGPEERLARAGLSARLLGEAIARAADTATAFEALQNSPSHLLTLLEPRFTDFGVGEARDTAGKRCYVVLLCAWPRYSGK